MAAYYEVKFRPEGTVVEFYGSEGNKYQLEDGAFLDIHKAPVWCRVCEKFAEGEMIESLSQLDQQLADLHDKHSRLYQIAQHPEAAPMSGCRAGMIAETGKRRKWREKRIAGPKCLHCGTTDIVVLPLGVEIPRPDSSGTLILELAGFASVGFSDGLFSPEGNRLMPDENPPR